MVRPTPLPELRQPHPEQARIDRDSAELLLRSAGLTHLTLPQPSIGAESESSTGGRRTARGGPLQAGI
jgi:hypothetical protein